MTKRIIRALENPFVNMIAHPSGRLLGARDPYEVEMDELMEAAKKYGKALEINAYFERLDLDDVHCRKAKEMGVRVGIGTDAHHLDQMWMMSLGVAVARRGCPQHPFPQRNLEVVPFSVLGFRDWGFGFDRIDIII
jgi:DNA polymerase (family 10)